MSTTRNTPCPICGELMDHYTDYLDGYLLCEEWLECDNGCKLYTNGYAYGNTDMRAWRWHFQYTWSDKESHKRRQDWLERRAVDIVRVAWWALRPRRLVRKLVGSRS